jgi:Family of unknown function (DUF5685)
MFGIVRPCRHRLCEPLQRSWMSHLCGLCLTLRDEHGHASRLATNYDGLLVSVLAQAQAPAGSPLRQAAPCVGRRLSRAHVVDSSSQGARLAASVSLVLAAGKTRDHIVDGDGAFGGRLASAAGRRIADQWASAGARMAGGVGFDAGVLTSALERQATLEQSAGRTGGGVGPRLLELTEPSETAVAAAFAHTAILAGKPQNIPALTEAGAHFGRLAHLLDAVEDLPEDRLRGAFNPLLATGTSRAEALRQCENSVLGIELAVADLDLEDDRLVGALLPREVRHAVDRAFGLASHSHSHSSAGASAGGPGFVSARVRVDDAFEPRGGRRRGLGCGCCDCCDCCECVECCACVECCDC